MFDFAWSEIALIGVVALVLIGPKDMPIALKYISTFVKKARRMATEFQGHVDEMVRDADLHEVRDQIREIRSLDIRGTIARAVDRDGSIRKVFTEDPMRTPPPVVTTPPEAMPSEAIGGDVAVVDTLPEHTIAAPADAAPAFIPPPAFTPAEPVRAAAPAFIPPEAAVLPPHPAAAPQSGTGA
jgi:sec-independent protein translocase protein TatB